MGIEMRAGQRLRWWVRTTGCYDPIISKARDAGIVTICLSESEGSSMYTIELTEGPGWDAPTLQARVIKTTVDLAKIEALAARWLHEMRQKPSAAQMPDGWRVVDGIGRRIKSSEI